jgi:hypothetical protein
MADADMAKSGEDDAALLAVEATEPVILQEPDRQADSDKDQGSDAPQNMVAPPKKPRYGLLGYLVAAVILAGAGFALAKFAFPDQSSATAIAALQAQIEAKSTEVAALRTDVAALAERPLPDATLVERIAALEAAPAVAAPDITGFESRLASLEDRLTAIETASVAGEGAPAAALVAMDREVKALKAAIAAQKGAGSTATADIEAASAAAQARLDAAEAAAQSAARQAALSHVRAAFESGAPLDSALAGLKALGATIPASLESAADGLPTLLALQDGFAEPARAALDASIRADMGDGWANRLTSFLRSQSGARSLTPREGTDPDAVLSRAEAALRSGDLASSLAELVGLPPAGAEAMQTWVTDANRRLDAELAITDLSATLNGQ